LKLTLRLKRRNHEGIQDFQIQNLGKGDSTRPETILHIIRIDKLI